MQRVGNQTAEENELNTATDQPSLSDYGTAIASGARSGFREGLSGLGHRINEREQYWPGIGTPLDDLPALANSVIEAHPLERVEIAAHIAASVIAPNALMGTVTDVAMNLYQTNTLFTPPVFTDLIRDIEATSTPLPMATVAAIRNTVELKTFVYKITKDHDLIICPKISDNGEEIHHPQLAQEKKPSLLVSS